MAQSYDHLKNVSPNEILAITTKVVHYKGDSAETAAELKRNSWDLADWFSSPLWNS
jgi:hypothetical protein